MREVKSGIIAEEKLLPSTSSSRLGSAPHFSLSHPRSESLLPPSRRPLTERLGAPRTETEVRGFFLKGTSQ